MVTMAPGLEPVTKQDGLGWLRSCCNKAAIERVEFRVSSLEFQVRVPGSFYGVLKLET